VGNDDVAAVAVTSQWSGTVPIDHAGEPLRRHHLDGRRGADDVARAAGGLVRVQGYECASCAPGSS
jgi:sugar (pentulose or hexulose) kinase